MGEIQAQAISSRAASPSSSFASPSGRGQIGQALTTRILDVVVSLSALVVLAPLLLLVALIIRLDSPGPVLFRQSRTGLNGRVFRIYKFRTMRVLEDGPEVQQATRNDARITSVGRILRCTHLDELPQLLNVLMGTMALVGPRPHALAHDAYYSREIPAYHLRFQVKPGITGWAQVNGARGETPTVDHMRRRIELDLDYVQNCSLTLNLIILLRTLREIRNGHHAY
jgi:exopolysaccharide biosynthesis polyprenyl glycosylphosphotransferase